MTTPSPSTTTGVPCFLEITARRNELGLSISAFVDFGVIPVRAVPGLGGVVECHFGGLVSCWRTVRSVRQRCLRPVVASNCSRAQSDACATLLVEWLG